MRIYIGMSVAAILSIAGPASAQPTTNPTTSPATATSNPLTLESPPESSETPTAQLGKVVVTSDLDIQRQEIAPNIGASIYTQTPEQIQNIPGGENAPFQQVLLRAPGVVEDSFGQEHVRGEHANLTYRDQRRSAAATDQPVFSGTRHATGRFGFTDHRSASGAVRISHRRHRRRDKPNPATRSTTTNSRFTAEASTPSTPPFKSAARPASSITSSPHPTSTTAWALKIRPRQLRATSRLHGPGTCLRIFLLSPRSDEPPQPADERDRRRL